MLTRRHHHRDRSASPTRGRSAALAPTAALAHPGLVAFTVALAALPALLTLVLRGDDLFLPLVLSGVVGGAAVGWAVDDPAADLLASMPIGTSLRTLFRAGSAAFVAGGVLGLLLVAVAIGPGLPPNVGDRAPEAATAAAAALAFGLIAARRGERAAGPAAVTVGVLGTTFVGCLAAKLTLLPSFMAGPHHSRWWLVALAAFVLALHAGRDPARR